MEASQQFEDILYAVMGSQLNFQLQHSPFYTMTSIKKLLEKAQSCHTLRRKARMTRSQDHDHEDVNQFIIFENKIKNLRLAKESSRLRETITILESKVTKTEASALRDFENHRVEVDILYKQHVVCIENQKFSICISRGNNDQK